MCFVGRLYQFSAISGSNFKVAAILSKVFLIPVEGNYLFLVLNLHLFISYSVRFEDRSAIPLQAHLWKFLIAKLENIEQLYKSAYCLKRVLKQFLPLKLAPK